MRTKLPFSEPCITSLLELQIFDEDKALKDEIVASAFFTKEEIKRKKVTN